MRCIETDELSWAQIAREQAAHRRAEAIGLAKDMAAALGTFAGIAITIIYALAA